MEPEWCALGESVFLSRQISLRLSCVQKKTWGDFTKNNQILINLNSQVVFRTLCYLAHQNIVKAQWVLGHMNSVGNPRADFLAKLSWQRLSGLESTLRISKIQIKKTTYSLIKNNYWLKMTILHINKRLTKGRTLKPLQTFWFLIDGSWGKL